MGVKALLVEDPTAIHYDAQIRRRDERVVHPTKIHFFVISRHLRKAQRLGGKAVWAQMSKSERSERARKRVRARNFGYGAYKNAAKVHKAAGRGGERASDGRCGV
jgi:hypothetical protein